MKFIVAKYDWRPLISSPNYEYNEYKFLLNANAGFRTILPHGKWKVFHLNVETFLKVYYFTRKIDDFRFYLLNNDNLSKGKTLLCNTLINKMLRKKEKMGTIVLKFIQ